MKRGIVFCVLLVIALAMGFAQSITEVKASDPYSDQYIDIRGDWNFKVYRKYDQMYQYLPYGMCNVPWEDPANAVVPDKATFSKWEVVEGPAADYFTGGLNQNYREPNAGLTRFAGELQDYELFPNWSEAWYCKTVVIPKGFLKESTVTVLLGVVDDNDILYVNGKPVALSGFLKADGSKAEPSDVPATGGFDMGGDFKFEKSYWEVPREYTIDSSLFREGENEICIRLYNNNSFGGFYDRTMAIVATKEALNYLKGLPVDKLADYSAYAKLVSAQVSALESKDIDAYAATLADNFNENEIDKSERLAAVKAWFESYDRIVVEDVDGGFFKFIGSDVYFCKRTIKGYKDGSETVISSNPEFIEYFAKVKGEVKERGNWSRSYMVSFVPSLAGMNGTTQQYGVYLPPSYYDNPEKSYPVVYLLHGMNSTGQSFINVDHIDQKMDEWIGSGDLIEMIVVMPNSGKTAGYRDSEGGPNDSSGPWMSYITESIVGEIEANYRVLSGKEFRAVSGISMGGGGVFTVGVGHLDEFTSFASHMGAVPSVDTAKEMLEGADLSVLDFYLDCGRSDQMVNPEATKAMGEYLVSIGARVIWELRDGAHNSAFYMQGMPVSMKMHSDHFVRNGAK